PSRRKPGRRRSGKGVACGREVACRGKPALPLPERDPADRAQSRPEGWRHRASGCGVATVDSRKGFMDGLLQKLKTDLPWAACRGQPALPVPERDPAGRAQSRPEGWRHRASGCGVATVDSRKGFMDGLLKKMKTVSPWAECPGRGIQGP